MTCQEGKYYLTQILMTMVIVFKDKQEQEVKQQSYRDKHLPRPINKYSSHQKQHFKSIHNRTPNPDNPKAIRGILHELGNLTGSF